MPPPDVSVCIANYNGGDLVLTCLASVLSQQGDFRVEILVHDDASTDDSPRQIRERFPDIRVIASDANAGFCISNNRMVEASSGRFVLLLNNDAVLRPGSLRAFFEFASAGHADCLLGLPQHAMADGRLVDRGYLTDPFLNPIPNLSPGMQEVGVVTGACLWVPRAIWNATGGFPPMFESVAEDIYLCLAARLLGYRVFILGQPDFDHVIGQHLGGGKVVADRLRTTTRRRRLSERNKLFAMLLCYPVWALALLLPSLAITLSIEALFLLATGAAVDKVQTIYGSLPKAIWRQRQHILTLRRALQSSPNRTPGLFRFTRWVPHKLVMLLRHGTPDVT